MTSVQTHYDNDAIIELIKEIDQLSFDDYCKRAMEYLGAQPAIPYLDMILSDTEKEGNPNVKHLLLKLNTLISNQTLPKINGFIGLGSILSYNEYPHEDYIGPFIEPDGVEVYNTKESAYTYVSGGSLQIVSGAQESEVIVNSSEMPGHYFILFHDGGVETVLATSDEQFIKAMVALGLLKLNETVFDAILAHAHQEDDDGTDFNLASHTLHTLLRCFDGISDTIEK